MKRALGLIGGVSALLAAGCGGAEPLSTISGSASTPSMSLPVAKTNISGILPFSLSGGATSRDGFDINVTPVGQPVLAPAAGWVTYVDGTPGAGIVYVLHNVHLMTRLSQLQSTSVVAGQAVSGGAALGQSSTTGAAPVHFTVLFDNGIVCPLSYLSFTDQSAVAAHAAGAIPCQ